MVRISGRPMAEENAQVTRELLVCQCGDVAHQLVVTDDGDMVIVSVVLDREAGFWRRAWYALRYLFGRPSKYGIVDEVIVRREDAAAFRRIADAVERSAP